jgi:Tol biopolymer transport system component
MKKTVALIGSILIIILFLTILSLAPQETGFRIVFRSARDAPLDNPDFQENPQRYFELYSMKADGSDVQRITDNLLFESQPDVSPDGRKIVCSIHYVAGNVNGTDPGWEISVMDADGENLQRLTDNDYLDFGAHWNFDGTKIVYVSDSAHRNAEAIKKNVLPQYDIYVMNADGTGKKQLTHADPGEVYADPSFSFTEPEKILYIHSEGLSGSFDLWIMDSDGENKQLIIAHNDTLLAINDPMFSPDDERIVFEAKIGEDQHGNPLYNLFIIDTTSSALTRITGNDGEADVLPQFSQDGEKIVYYTYVFEKGEHTHRIRVADTDGSNEHTISTYPWEADPTWTPITTP